MRIVLFLVIGACLASGLLPKADPIEQFFTGFFKGIHEKGDVKDMEKCVGTRQ